MDTVLTRIGQLADNEKVTITRLEQLIGASKGVLSRALAKKTDIQCKWLVKIVENYPLYDASWLLTGTGNMFKEDNRNKYLIPLFNDIASVSEVSESEEIYTTAYIDPGDWFPAASAAMRYHNLGMTAYQPGCVLILRKKDNPRELVWGEDYVIGYGDNRILRTVQPAEDKEHLYAYATDESTYVDGRAKYPPLLINIDRIKLIFQVLGHIHKRESQDRIHTRP